MHSNNNHKMNTWCGIFMLALKVWKRSFHPIMKIRQALNLIILHHARFYIWLWASLGTSFSLHNTSHDYDFIFASKLCSFLEDAPADSLRLTWFSCRPLRWFIYSQHLRSRFRRLVVESADLWLTLFTFLFIFCQRLQATFQSHVSNYDSHVLKIDTTEIVTVYVWI